MVIIAGTESLRRDDHVLKAAAGPTTNNNIGDSLAVLGLLTGVEGHAPGSDESGRGEVPFVGS